MKFIKLDTTEHSSKVEYKYHKATHKECYEEDHKECCCRIRPLKLLKTCAMAGDSCFFAPFKFLQQKLVFKETPSSVLLKQTFRMKTPIVVGQILFSYSILFCKLNLLIGAKTGKFQVSRKSVLYIQM